MSFTDLHALLPLETNGLNATFGYIGSAIVLLGLAWVVVLAIRRYLKAPKDYGSGCARPVPPTHIKPSEAQVPVLARTDPVS